MMRLRSVFSFFLFVPAVLPLIYIGGIIYPYVTPKTFLLQGSGIVALALFAFLALMGESFFYRRLRAPATWIPALLLAVAYVTSFFGIDFYHSFWGIFGRGDGLLTLTAITTFFYLILLFADNVFLKRLARIITIVAGVVASVAILQWVTTAFGDKAWFLPPVSGRIGSTFGNAAFLAGYLGMTFFVTLAILKDSSVLWRRVCKIVAVLSVFAIVLAATRGTILALASAGIVALVFAAWSGNKKIKQSARYGLMAAVVFVGLFFVFRNQLAQSSFEPVRRVASISLSDGTVSSRLFVWSHITSEALQRPFSGYGAEHVAQLFDKVYDPSKIVEQWFDRSHNSFLDYFAQYGVFGLASYLALIGAFAAYAIRLYHREESSITNSGSIFLLLILTYSIQNFFVFDTPSSLWLLYAFFAFLIVKTSDVSTTQLSSWRLPSFVSGIVSLLILFLIIPTVVRPLQANILLTKGYKYHLIDVSSANLYFEKGLSLKTYADMEYGYQAYEMYTARQSTQLNGQDLSAAYQFALSTLTRNFGKYPYDARTATYLGHVIDTAPTGVVVDDDFDDQVLSRAIELSPLRSQAWYMRANIPIRKANKLPAADIRREKYYRDATAILEEYVQKEPTLPVPRYTLANIYYVLGDTSVARKWADEAYPLYVNSDITAAKPAVKYYLAVGDWNHAVRFLSDLVAHDPTNYETLYDLAKVIYLAGDPATASRIVEKLRVENPDILQTDQNFINAITVYEQSKK